MASCDVRRRIQATSFVGRNASSSSSSSSSRARNRWRTRASGSEAQGSVPPRTWRTWWAFARPHTMVGTAVSVASVSYMAVGSAVTHACGAKIVQALASALLMNVAIVGINQVHDVEVDKINKPHLPLASGDMDVVDGRKIAYACAFASLWIGSCPWSAPLVCTLVGSLLLGVLYSTDVAGMRWKKHPALAAACIFAVRAVLVQLGFSMHAQGAAGQAVRINRPVAVTMVWMAVYSLVIALFKDVPDVRGDEENAIRTLSVRVGPRAVFRLCMGMLTALYFAAVGYTWMACEGTLFRVVGVAIHLLFLAALWIRSKVVVLDSTTSLHGFYMFLWKLFYVEYLVLPFLR